MTNEKIKKYVIPNLPYLFIFILFCNVGEAYRVSDGRNILFRCVNTLQNVGEALHNPFPALNINDWIFGIVGVVAVYLIVQYRRKNAKKWRKDVLFCKGCIFLCPKNQTVNAFAAHERKAEHYGGLLMETKNTAVLDEPYTLLKRVNSTLYVINIHFSKSQKETVEDKLIRIIEKEAFENSG